MIRQRAALTASILFVATRIGLGALWIHEGYVKFHAHFGSADILLVVAGAGPNSRVPGYFQAIADNLLRPAAGLAGVLTPLTEVGLGVALIVGLFSVPVAIGSAILLATYWSSDQLIAQYPIMIVLSVAVVAGHAYVDRWSVNPRVRGLVRKLVPSAGQASEGNSTSPSSAMS